MTITDTRLTPEQLSEAFWNMDSDQQADFFAALEDLAGVRLCFKRAGCVTDTMQRVDQLMDRWMTRIEEWSAERSNT